MSCYDKKIRSNVPDILRIYHVYRMLVVFILVVAYIYIYPHIYYLCALRSFGLAFLWGIILISSGEFSRKTFLYCFYVGIFGLVTYGVYDVVIFPAIGTVAAFVALPNYLKWSNSKRSDSLFSFLYRLIRSTVALSCGIIFLSLPISRNSGVGEYARIEITFYYFAGLVGFMAIPVLLFDAIFRKYFCLERTTI